MRTITILSGIPGSGKSTYGRNRAAWGDIYLSRDDFRANLRREMKTDDYFPLPEKEEWKRWTDTIVRSMLAFPGTPIWIDQTTLTQKALDKLLTALSPYIGDHDAVEVHIIHTNIGVCLERNAMREGHERVPDDVIRNMHASVLKDPITADTSRYRFPNFSITILHETCMES